MNGRIYDPQIGRFLSADKEIDGPLSVQGYNRYTYVHNNPVTNTDSTGYNVLAGIQNQSFAESRLREDLGTEKADAIIATNQGINAAVGTVASSIVVNSLPVIGDVFGVIDDGGTILDSGESTGSRAIAGMSLAVTLVGPNVGRIAGTFNDAMDTIADTAKIAERAADKVDSGKDTARAVNNINEAAPDSKLVDAPNEAYRYVGPGEAKVIDKTGSVPNTTATGKSKHVSYTFEKIDNVSEAESTLKMGKQDPRGAFDSPTHRVTVDTTNASLSYGGNGDTAGTIEIRTPDELKAIRLEELQNR